MRRAASALGLALALSLSLVPGGAQAHGSADICSVVRKCSATGALCSSGDRACQDQALARGLEVVCDVQQGADEKLFVYCPPLSEQRDSKIVWLLLGLAVLLAVGGTGVLLLILRKKG